MKASRSRKEPILWIGCVALAGTQLLPIAVARAETIEVADAADLRTALARAGEDHEVDRIELAAGIYTLDAPLVLDERHSRKDDQPLVITARPGATAMLFGSRALPRLDWRPWKEGVWRAKLAGASFQKLWFDDVNLVRARYPNFDPDVLPFNGAAADAVAPSRTMHWHDPAGGILHALHGGRWGGVHVPITGKDFAGQLTFGEKTGNNRDAPPHAQSRYVENIFEELDAPGEWFHDRKSGWLYLKPVNGKRPAQFGFRAGNLETLIDIEGGSTPVRNVRIENIALRHTEPTFLKATEPLLRSDWKFHRAGAVTIENAERVTISGLDMTDLAGNGIVVSGHARNVGISRNYIRAIGGTAVAFVGRPEAVRSPLFEYNEFRELSDIDRTPGPANDRYPSDSEASDNLIHDIGLIDKQATGIEIAMAARITVDHNSIYRVPRAGINIGDGTWGGHVISNNDVFDTVRESGDHGAFNSWGRDRFWHPDRAEMDRRTAAEPGLILLDVVDTIVLKHNRFQCDHGWDIDLDDGSSNYLIEDNVMLTGGLKLREGFYRTVRNNIMVNNTFHPHVWFKDSGDVFEHNIVMSGYEPIRVDHWGQSVDHNLFLTGRGLADAQARGTDANSVSGDPLFVSPASGDYSVQEGSLALVTGFKNFAMDDFGVRSPKLRQLAERPKFPEPRLEPAPNATEQPMSLFGMAIKSVETLGEQSAAGLLDKEAVMVLSVEPNGSAARAGLKAGDVILSFPGTPDVPERKAETAASFATTLQGRKWQGTVRLLVRRNQKDMELDLDLTS